MPVEHSSSKNKKVKGLIQLNTNFKKSKVQVRTETEVNKVRKISQRLLLAISLLNIIIISNYVQIKTLKWFEMNIYIIHQQPGVNRREAGQCG